MNQARSTRLLVADDTPVIRKAIKALLADESSIVILGEAENFKQTLSMASSLKPDIILLDLHMPDDWEYEPGIIRDHLSICGSRVLAMSLGDREDEETKRIADGFGAVAMLDKAKLNEVLIPAIWKISGVASQNV